jgi:hypothetical protein
MKNIYYIVISCLFREQSKLLYLGAEDDLGTVTFGLRQQFSSSPAPRVNNFDCSLNRHEITVYCDNVSLPYHSQIGAQHCFERNTAFDSNDAVRIVLGHGTVRIRK